MVAGVFIGSGVAFILEANIGSDTITVFQDGLHNLLNISYGQASRLYNIVLLAVAIFFSRKNIGFGTIVSAFVTGYIIDFVLMALCSLFSFNSMIFNFILFIFGMILYCFGLAVLIVSNAGMNALDAIIYQLCAIFHYDYKKIRLLVDSLLTLFGISLGGIFGFGTIASILLTGTLVDLLCNTMYKKKN